MSLSKILAPSLYEMSNRSPFPTPSPKEGHKQAATVRHPNHNLLPKAV